MANNNGGVLTYRYRIYPNKAQIASLSHIFSFCCDLYNSALQERRSHFEKFKKNVSYAHQAKELLEIKQSFKNEVESIYSQVLQSTLKRIDVAFANFFRRVKQKASKCGFPRFKSQKHFKSILFPQCDFNSGGVKLLDAKHIRIFGVENPIRIKMHRPFLGRCKTVAIKRESCDKFYVVLTCVDVLPMPHAQTGKTTALDLGLVSFITTDVGAKISHPKPYKTAKEKLKHKQQKLAAKQRGSNNRKRAKLELAKQHEKISNIRKDFLHKTAKQLVDQNDALIVEDLNVKNMLENNIDSCVAKNANIVDASFATFISILEYKAARAGVSIIKVDPRNTSKTCSHCGVIKQNLRLEDRVFHCQVCNLAMDRDQNAALNIRRLGMSHVKTEASMLSV